MPNGHLTIAELGAQTKAKYPQYANMSDEEVGNAVLKKYPQYQSKIIPDKKKESTTSQNGAPSSKIAQPPSETVTTPISETKEEVPKEPVSPLDKMFGAGASKEKPTTLVEGFVEKYKPQQQKDLTSDELNAISKQLQYQTLKMKGFEPQLPAEQLKNEWEVDEDVQSIARFYFPLSNYRDDVAKYFWTVKQSNPERFATLKSKADQGELSQEEKFNIEQQVLGEKLNTIANDAEILEKRNEPEKYNEKAAAYNQALDEYKGIIKNYPKVAEEQAKQRQYELSKQPTSPALAPYQQMVGQFTEGINRLRNLPMRGVQGILTAGKNLGDAALELAGTDVSDYSAVDKIFDKAAEGLDFATARTQPKPFWNEDGSINTEEILPMVVEQVGIMGMIAAGASPTTKALQTAGLASKPAQFAGLTTSSYMLTVDEYMKNGLERGMSESEARGFATKSAAVQGFLESVNPNLKFLYGSKPILQGAEQLIKEGAKPTTKQLAKQYFSNIAREDLQETLQLAGDKMNEFVANETLGENYFNPAITKNEIVETVLITSLVTGLVGGGELRLEGQRADAARYSLAQMYRINPTQVTDAISTQQQAGNITEQAAKDITADIQKYAGTLSKIPQNFTDKQKSEVAPLVQEKQELEKQKESVDESFHPQIDEQIKAKDEQIQQIISPKPETKDAVQIEETAEGVLRDGGIRRESELQGVVEQDQPEGATEVSKEKTIGVDVGEEMRGNKLPSLNEVYEMVRNEHESQGNDFVGENGAFQTKAKAKEYVKEIRGIFDSLDDNVPIYRAVLADEVDLDPYGIGESWTFDLRAAKQFAKMNLSGENVKIIKAYVPRENIDFERSIRAYANFSDLTDADSEFEVYIQPNSKLLKVQVDDFKSAKELSPFTQPTAEKTIVDQLDFSELEDLIPKEDVPLTGAEEISQTQEITQPTAEETITEQPLVEEKQELVEEVLKGVPQRSDLGTMETKFKGAYALTGGKYYLSKGINEQYYTLRFTDKEGDYHIANVSKDLSSAKQKAKKLTGQDVEFDAESLGRDYTPSTGGKGGKKTGEGQIIAEGKGTQGTAPTIEKDYSNVPFEELKMPFGKYAGKGVLEILNEDRGYFEWFIDNASSKDAKAIIERVKQHPDVAKVIAEKEQRISEQSQKREQALKNANAPVNGVPLEVEKVQVPTDDLWEIFFNNDIDASGLIGKSREEILKSPQWKRVVDNVSEFGRKYDLEGNVTRGTVAKNVPVEGEIIDIKSAKYGDLYIIKAPDGTIFKIFDSGKSLYKYAYERVGEKIDQENRDYPLRGDKIRLNIESAKFERIDSETGNREFLISGKKKPYQPIISPKTETNEKGISKESTGSTEEGQAEIPTQEEGVLNVPAESKPTEGVAKEDSFFYDEVKGKRWYLTKKDDGKFYMQRFGSYDTKTDDIPLVEEVVAKDQKQAAKEFDRLKNFYETERAKQEEETAKLIEEVDREKGVAKEQVTAPSENKVFEYRNKKSPLSGQHYEVTDVSKTGTLTLKPIEGGKINKSKTTVTMSKKVFDKASNDGFWIELPQPTAEKTAPKVTAPSLEEKSILNQETDLKGNEREAWMYSTNMILPEQKSLEGKINELLSKGKELTIQGRKLNVHPVQYGKGFEVTTIGMQPIFVEYEKKITGRGEEFTGRKISGEHIDIPKSIESIDEAIEYVKKIYRDKKYDRYGGFEHKINAVAAGFDAEIKDAIEKGKYQKAISEGRMTANDAKTIIESAGLKVPQDILDAAAQKPSLEEKENVSDLPLTGAEKSTQSTAEKQLYKIGKSPQTYEIVEELPFDPNTDLEGEKAVRVRNTKTGREETVLETDLKPVKKRRSAEKVIDDTILNIQDFLDSGKGKGNVQGIIPSISRLEAEVLLKAFQAVKKLLQAGRTLEEAIEYVINKINNTKDLKNQVDIDKLAAVMREQDYEKDKPRIKLQREQTKEVTEDVEPEEEVEETEQEKKVRERWSNYDKRLDKKLKDDLKFYYPQQNDKRIGEAEKYIDEHGIEASVGALVENDLDTTEKIFLSQVLEVRLDAMFEQAKQANDEAAMKQIAALTDRVFNYIIPQSSVAGDVLQSLRMIYIIHPEAKAWSYRNTSEQKTKKEVNRHKDEGTIKNIADDVNEVNKKAAEKVAGKIEGKVKTDAVKEKKSIVQKAREKRQKVIDKFRKKGGGLFLSTGGLTPDGIEFVTEVAITYIQEGIGHIEELVNKVIKTIKDAGFDKIPDDVLDQIRAISGKELEDHNQKILREMVDRKILSEIITEHWTNPSKQTLKDKFFQRVAMSEEEAGRLAKSIENMMSAATKAEKQKIVKRYLKRPVAQVKAAKTRDERIVDEISLLSESGAIDEKAVELVFKDKYQLTHYDPKVFDILKKMGERVKALPVGSIARNEAVTEQLAYFDSVVNKAGLGQYFQMYYFANLLIGIGTNVVNNLTNISIALGRYAANLGKHLFTNPKAVLAMHKEFANSFRRGRIEGSLSLRTGKGSYLNRVLSMNPAQREKLRRDVEKEYTDEKGTFSDQMMWGFLKYVNVPNQLLNGSDALFHELNRGISLMNDAVKDLKNEGYKGDALAAELRKRLQTDTKRESATQQAKDEGFNPNGTKNERLQYRRRVEEIVESNIFKSQHRANSYVEAAVATLKNKPRGFISRPFAKGMNWVNQNTGLWFISPFVNVIWNIYDLNVRYSPFGWFDLALYKVLGEQRVNRVKDAEYDFKRDMRDRVVQSSIGTALTLTAAYLALMAKCKDGKTPLVDFSGSGTGDHSLDAVKRRGEGYRPYSLRVCDGRWISYRFFPAMLSLSLVGNYVDGQKMSKVDAVLNMLAQDMFGMPFDELDEDQQFEVTDKATEVGDDGRPIYDLDKGGIEWDTLIRFGTSTFSTLYENAAINSLFDFAGNLKGITEPKQGTEFQNQVANILSSSTAPQVYRETVQASRGRDMDKGTIFEYYSRSLSAVPHKENIALDAFGKEIKTRPDGVMSVIGQMTLGRLTAFYKSDEVWKFLSDNNIKYSKPANFGLTEFRYKEYLTRHGEVMYEWLLENKEDLSELPKSEMTGLISKAKSATTNNIKIELGYKEEGENVGKIDLPKVTN